MTASSASALAAQYRIIRRSAKRALRLISGRARSSARRATYSRTSSEGLSAEFARAPPEGKVPAAMPVWPALRPTDSIRYSVRECRIAYSRPTPDPEQ